MISGNFKALGKERIKSECEYCTQEHWNSRFSQQVFTDRLGQASIRRKEEAPELSPHLDGATVPSEDTDHEEVRVTASGVSCCPRHQSHSRVCLFVTPLTIAHQAPLSMEFSRQEHWSGLSFRGLYHINTHQVLLINSSIL